MFKELVDVFLAFDVIKNKPEAMEKLITLGFKRILTAGGIQNAIAGARTLRDLIYQVNNIYIF